MSVITTAEVPVSNSIQRSRPALEGKPLTYGLLRHGLLDNGSSDERAAGELDRAMRRQRRSTRLRDGHHPYVRRWTAPLSQSRASWPESRPVA
jgi:hypothetical protein